MEPLRHQTVTRYVTPLREGGSLPAVAEADDGFSYVLKFRGAGHGPKALVAELIGGEVARALGFRVPELVLLDVGEEFGRTKLGEGNSYRSSPELNMLRWERAGRFAPLTDYYRGLIRLRKSLPGLCDKSAAAVSRVTDGTVHRPWTVSFQVEGGGPGGERLLVVYNASPEPFSLPLPEGRWTVRADGCQADQRRPARQGPVVVPAYSGMLLLREDG